MSGKPGWRKRKENPDIRDAMKAKGMGQKELAKATGTDIYYVNRLLQKDPMPQNIHEALMETIKRYDPVTNPDAR